MVGDDQRLDGLPCITAASPRWPDPQPPLAGPRQVKRASQGRLGWVIWKLSASVSRPANPRCRPCRLGPSRAYVPERLFAVTWIYRRVCRLPQLLFSDRQPWTWSPPRLQHHPEYAPGVGPFPAPTASLPKLRVPRCAAFWSDGTIHSARG